MPANLTGYDLAVKAVKLALANIFLPFTTLKELRRRTMRARTPWTPEEDKLLSHHVEVNMKAGSDKLWNHVALNLPKRTNKDCRKRWIKLGAHLKKGSWTKEEDQELQNAVDKVGCNWTLVAGILRTRHAEQCSKRWQYHLDPSIDHTRWDMDADTLLLKCYESHGRTWNSIKKEVFPQRSATDIKNRCNLLLRRRQRPSATKLEKPRIPPTNYFGPTLNESESITRRRGCLEENDHRERNQNTLDLSTQLCMDTLDGGLQQTSMAPRSFFNHIVPTINSIESDYNNINEVCWQKVQGDTGGGSMEQPASSGVSEPPMLAALLRQMKNQANLPPLLWLDNYFPMSDPLWGGILSFEQPPAEGHHSPLPQNQVLGRPYLGSLGDDTAEYTRSDTIWHGLQK
ncbi:hypothetical protein V496_08229 [Pseudogymnoascus sp. VKM F-4515 (FW-2607)]|nr:hypothetical protein V496_08229 [Pseudogymnoascus sp. VKM F-4515 (FW-2607)]KFY95543.1 hypothetical protein V498_03315 [Pseudogymnoascus sp. VKM F-4517 (FW-2822)]